MKCRFVKDMDVEPSSMSDSEREKIQFREMLVYTKSGAVTRRLPYFPAGTVYECRNATFFVMAGDAEPADDECSLACGLTAEQIAVLQRKRFKEEHIRVADWHLFEAGVIEGYDPDDDEHDGYKPGMNWDKYWAAQEEDEEEGDE